MAFYKKTLKKVEKAAKSTNRDRINEVFTDFYNKWHDENISFAAQRAYSLFGRKVTPEMVEDAVNDLYFTILVMDEEDLLKMDTTDLIKVFRSMVNGVAFTGAMHQQVKNYTHEDIEDYE